MTRCCHVLTCVIAGAAPGLQSECGLCPGLEAVARAVHGGAALLLAPTQVRSGAEDTQGSDPLQGEQGEWVNKQFDGSVNIQMTKEPFPDAGCLALSLITS